MTSPVFVGRDEELAALTETLGDVAGGTSRCVLVGGEAGMGKSRLVAEATATAEREGFRVLRGQCVELGADGMPLVPLVEALRTLARTTRPVDLEPLLGPARAELSRLLPDLDPGSWQSSHTAGASTGQLLELVLGVLERVAGRAPLLLVVEDVHWADQSTTELLAFLVRTLRTARVCLLMTFRSDELHRRHPLRPFLRAWERDPSVRTLQLRGFTGPEVAALLRAILGSAPDPGLLALVTDRSEGNPFLVEEITAAVRVGEPLSEVPESLRDVLLSRVDALSDPAQQLLRAASAAGRSVSDRLLAAVAGLDEPVLIAALREVVDRQFLVVDDSGTGYAYRHALLRQAVYDDLLPGEKLRLHSRYAERLSTEPDLAGDASPAAQLALHWYAALDLPRALSASVDAGRQAAAAYAPAEAQRHFERALEVWPRVEDAEQRAGTDQIGVLRLACEAALQAGSPTRALALVDRAVELLGDGDQRERLPELLDRRAFMLRSLGRDADALAVVDAALRALPAEGPSHIRAALLTGRATSLTHVRDLGAAREAAQAAVDAARQADAGALEANALITLGTAQAYVGDVGPALEALRAGLERAEQLGIAETALRGYINQSDVLELAGHPAAAVAAAEQGIALAGRVGMSRTYGAYLTGNRVESLFHLGRWDEADRAAAEALAGAPEGIFAATLLEVRAEIAVGAGRYPEAAAFAEQVRTLLGDVTDDQFLQPLAYVGAESARARGDLATARAVVADALTGGSTLLGRYAWPLVWLGMRTEADAATRARDLRVPVPDEVRAGAAALSAIAEGLPTGTSSVAVYRELVRAELARLDGGPALAVWSAAVASCRERGEPLLLSYALLRVAAEAVSAADRDLGAEALRESVELARRIGAHPLVDEGTALARRARVELAPATDSGPPSPEPDDPLARFGLTPREREILELIAAGRSNGQIAAALFISPKTASVHVSRILAKLGVAGRIEAAAVAHRLGLLSPEDAPTAG
ncbi:helix-turn-helix transcriptional regulator [Blastococcus litoris]|uniref:helix-turn-helix transcriptional regulator n=1 Tax=Blastococcus litoris TaxID=2171622 RepID=UPI0013DFFA44|nr:helix-turn-helix transcriptional regulator [Blastococcus litoris]